MIERFTYLLVMTCFCLLPFIGATALNNNYESIYETTQSSRSVITSEVVAGVSEESIYATYAQFYKEYDIHYKKSAKTIENSNMENINFDLNEEEKSVINNMDASYESVEQEITENINNYDTTEVYYDYEVADKVTDSSADYEEEVSAIKSSIDTIDEIEEPETTQDTETNDAIREVQESTEIIESAESQAETRKDTTVIEESTQVVENIEIVSSIK